MSIATTRRTGARDGSTRDPAGARALRGRRRAWRSSSAAWRRSRRTCARSSTVCSTGSSSSGRRSRLRATRAPRPLVCVRSTDVNAPRRGAGRRANDRRLDARGQAARRAPPLQRRGGRRSAPRRADPPPRAARLTRVVAHHSFLPHRASRTATTPTRWRTSIARPTELALAVRRPDPRRVLANRLGPDADDAACDRPRGAGIAAWNVEYRRVGQEGGGWPGARRHRRCGRPPRGAGRRRPVTRGHVRPLRGGHLALWLAGRGRIAGGLPGADPEVRPIAVVAQAAVSDLERGGGTTSAAAR